MKAILEVPSLGGGHSVQEAEVRINPMPARPRPSARRTDYQVQYRGVWFRVERLPSGAMFFGHAVGRIRVSIKRED